MGDQKEARRINLGAEATITRVGVTIMEPGVSEDGVTAAGGVDTVAGGDSETGVDSAGDEEDTDEVITNYFQIVEFLYKLYNLVYVILFKV